MATSPTVPMYAPDGTLGDIPYDQMSAALRAGGKLGVNMTAPDGTKGVIPADHVQEAAKSGGKIIPFDLSKAPAGTEKKGVWDTFSDDVKSVFSGLWNKATEGKPTYEQTPEGAAKAIADMEAESKARQATDVSRQKEGHGLPYRVGAGIAENVGANVTGMEQGAREGNSDAVIGHMLAGQALASAPLAVEGLTKVAPKLRDATGTALRTETGALKPGVKAVSSLAKMVGGPEIAEAVIPSRPGSATMVERRAVPIKQSPNYDPAAYKAGEAERVSPNGESVPITQSPHYTQWQEKVAEEAAARRAAIKEASKLDAEARKAVPVSESPYYNQNQEKIAADTKLHREAAAAEEEANKPVPITKSPSYDPGAYKAGTAQRTTGSGQPSTIVPPSAGAPKVGISEGRPATWTNERVIQLAAKGDRNAIAQAVRRGFMLPENVRYVMGDMDYSSGVSNPKSVTKFTPTGGPIVQGAPMEDVAYRSRDVGEHGVPSDARSHAHATTDLEDLQRLAPGRESVTGKPQEFIKADLSKLEEGKDFVRVHRPGQADWIRFLRPLKESEIERVSTQ